MDISFHFQPYVFPDSIRHPVRLRVIQVSTLRLYNVTSTDAAS